MVIDREGAPANSTPDREATLKLGEHDSLLVQELIWLPEGTLEGDTDSLVLSSAMPREEWARARLGPVVLRARTILVGLDTWSWLSSWSMRDMPCCGGGILRADGLRAL